MSDELSCDFEIIVPLARQLSWSHFPATINQRSESARIAPKQSEINDNGTIWKFLIVQSDKAQQAKRLIEPFCRHQQYGFEWILPLNKEITPEVTPEVTPQVTPEVLRMLQITTGKMSRIDIMTALGLKDENMNEMFPDHFEELLDMDISGTGRKLRPVQEACTFTGHRKMRYHTKYNVMAE